MDGGRQRSDDAERRRGPARFAHVLRPTSRDRLRAVGRCAVAVAVGVGALVLAVTDRETPGTWILAAAIAFVVAVRLGGVVQVMARGPGRVVIVDDRRSVGATAGGIWTWNYATGHWIHLTDAPTGRALGWIEVRGRAGRELTDVERCGLVGDPSRHSGAVLTGPFGTIVPRGHTYRDLPTPYFRIAGRAWRGSRPARGPQPPGD